MSDAPTTAMYAALAYGISALMEAEATLKTAIHECRQDVAALGAVERVKLWQADAQMAVLADQLAALRRLVAS